jgi:hypothetical protein
LRQVKPNSIVNRTKSAGKTAIVWQEELSELEAVLVEYLDEDAIFGSQEELAPSQVKTAGEGAKSIDMKSVRNGQDDDIQIPLNLCTTVSK